MPKVKDGETSDTRDRDTRDTRMTMSRTVALRMILYEALKSPPGTIFDLWNGSSIRPFGGKEVRYQVCVIVT